MKTEACYIRYVPALSTANAATESTCRILYQDNVVFFADFLYLQENFIVTDGIFIDENVIFDNVTPEWIDFCVNVLKFEVPKYASTSSEKTES